MFRNCCKQSDMAAIYKKLDLDKFLYLTGNIHSLFLSANIEMAELMEVDAGKALKKKRGVIWRHKRVGGKKENSDEKGGMGGYLRSAKLVIILSLSLSLSFAFNHMAVCEIAIIVLDTCIYN